MSDYEVVDLGGTPVETATPVVAGPRGPKGDPGLSNVSTEQGVGKMMHAFVPAGHFYMLSTETIAGWNPPGFQTVDGVGFYQAAPFTDAGAYLPAPPVNTWQQNTTGVAVRIGIMAAIVGSQGTNGHMYLITSPDGVNVTRQDFLALRTGAAGT